MFSLRPVLKLSTQTTSWPSPSSRSQRWQPKNPAPPVTRTRIERLPPWERLRMGARNQLSLPGMIGGNLIHDDREWRRRTKAADPDQLRQARDPPWHVLKAGFVRPVVGNEVNG